MDFRPPLLGQVMEWQRDFRDSLVNGDPRHDEDEVSQRILRHQIHHPENRITSRLDVQLRSQSVLGVFKDAKEETYLFQS